MEASPSAAAEEAVGSATTAAVTHLVKKSSGAGRVAAVATAKGERSMIGGNEQSRDSTDSDAVWAQANGHRWHFEAPRKSCRLTHLCCCAA